MGSIDRTPMSTLTPSMSDGGFMPYPMLNRSEERPVTLNTSTPPEKLAFGEYWALAGVDGRFTDSVRRFPGFSQLRYTLRTDALTRTTAYDITLASQFYLFKYAEINKGGSDYSMRGFVIVCNDFTVAGSPLTLGLFLHYDSETKSWYTYKINALSGLSPGGLVVDAATVNKLLVVNAVNEAGTAVAKTVYWKYSTVGAVSGEGSFVEATSGPTGVTITLAVVPTWQQSSDHGRIRNDDNAPSVQVMFRAFSPTRRLWATPLGPYTVAGTSAISTFYYIYTRIDKSVVATMVAAGFTKLYCYRTIDGGGTFYLEQIVNFNEDPAGDGTSNGLATDVFLGTSDYTGGTNYEIVMGGRNSLHNVTSTSAPKWSLGANDAAVVLQRLYDPFLDASGATPTGGLIANYGGQLVARDAVSNTSQSTTAAIRWSTLFSESPENFPEEDHTYRPTVLGSTLLDVLAGGDYGWGLRNDGAVRLHRNGTVMAINELYRKVGVTCRWGATTVGDLLYMVTRLGLMQVDGTSGRQDVVASVERYFISPDKWAKDLSKVRVLFDGSLGALMVLNSTFEEMLLLWFANGAVTTLDDVPFLLGTEGSDPVNFGPPTAWWLAASGKIYRSNYDRSAPKQTMCGTLADEVSNGRASMGSIAAQDKKTKFGVAPITGTYPNKCPAATGFWVHFLSGQNINLKRKISAVTSGTPDVVTLSKPLPYDIAENDQFAIGPVTMRVGLHGLRKTELPDLFGVKTSRAASVSLKVWSGDVDPTSNPGAKMEVRMVESPTGVVRSKTEQVTTQTSRMVVAVPHRGTTLLPEIVQKSADLDLELLSVSVDGTIEASSSNI